MTISKKIMIAALMLASGSMAFAHYALQLKKELVLIDNFVKELSTIENLQAQALVVYLKDVLKNDAGNWYGHRDENARFVSDDEVLAIVRIIKADMTFEIKQSEITKIMNEELEKDIQIKSEMNKRKWLDRLYAASGVIALASLAVCFAK